MDKNKLENNNEKIHRTKHNVPNGYIDINSMIYEMHGVLSTDAYAEISKQHKFI